MTTDNRQKKNAEAPAGGDRSREQPGPDRALVVDDDREICEVVAISLRRVGYDVETVQSADLAIRSFLNHPPDVIISDWKMPGMNGIDLVTRLKKEDPELAAILMTGYGTKDMVVEAFTRGKIDYYLAKPFKLEELLEVVSAAVKGRRIRLSEARFRERLENEIQSATCKLEEKNRLLQQKHSESETLYQQLACRTEEVEDTKKYLESLIESSVDGIVSATSEGKISFFSRGAEEMLGYRSSRILNRDLAVLFGGDAKDLNQMLALLDEQDRLQHFETILQKADNSPLVADISASTVGEDGGASGILLIIKDIADRKRLEEELRASNTVLERLSITDGLTSLYNHRHFQSRLAEEFQRARRFKAPLSLIMLDLDDFKVVNDTHGHQVGDQVLMLLAELINECVREVDTPARYGGEEFAIILPQTELDDAVIVAERIKKKVEYSERYKDIRPGLAVTASIGLAGYPEEDIHSPQDLIRYADKALYRAKHIGKNRVVIGSPSGETPLGRGERLTQAEKKIILRRVGDTLRGMLDLEKVLEYILGEIALTLRQTEREPACSIMLMDRHKGLVSRAERGLHPKQSRNFEISAHLALEKKAVHIFKEAHKHGPSVSFPIVIQWPERGGEVVGVINVGLIPGDLDFLQDIANHAAMGILNAKLFNEAEATRAELETKVKQLMTLSLMGMALQRNALSYEDFREENKKLVARSLTEIGMEKVFVYDYDPEGPFLYGGVDSSFRGDGAPERIPLSGLKSSCRLRRALRREIHRHAPVAMVSRVEDLSEPEQRALSGLDIDGRSLAVTKVQEQNQTTTIIIAVKSELGEEEGEALSMFALHASLIMENLSLAEIHQDKSRRLALIQEAGRALALASTAGEKRRAAGNAIKGLIEVLRATEISIYEYRVEEEILDRTAFTSDTAGPGGEPVRRIRVDRSAVMSGILEKALASGHGAPIVLNDLAETLGRRLKKRYASTSYIGLPLVAAGRVLGIMNVTDKFDRSSFTSEDVELARLTADMMAMAMLRFAHDRKMERALNASVDRLLENLDAKQKPPLKGHAQRVAELVLGLSPLVGLNEREADRTALRARVGLLNRAVSGNAEWVAPAARTIEDWQATLAIADETPDSRGIIAVAEFFDLEYLGLPPRNRPPLIDLFARLAQETPGRFTKDSVRALATGLVQKRLRRSKRVIKIGEDEWNTLFKKKARSRRRQGKTDPGDSRFLKELADVVQKERLAQGER